MASLLADPVDDFVEVDFEEERRSAHALRRAFLHPDGDIFSIGYPNIAVEPLEKGKVVWWQDCFLLEDPEHDVPVDWIKGAFDVDEESMSIGLDSSISVSSVLEGIHDAEGF